MQDVRRQIPLEIRERFKHRKDKLFERKRRPMQNVSRQAATPTKGYQIVPLSCCCADVRPRAGELKQRDLLVHLSSPLVE